jgi:predicted RNase H-like HicB family nuclease
MTIDPHAYNIVIRRDIFEGEMLFEARIKELPDVAEYGETHAEAYDLAIDTIETTAMIFAEKDRAFPKAQVPVDNYSGRVTLRISPSLHRSLAEAAEDERVSLNQHLVNVLYSHTVNAVWNSMSTALNNMVNIGFFDRTASTSEKHIDINNPALPFSVLTYSSNRGLTHGNN